MVDFSFVYNFQNEKVSVAETSLHWRKISTQEIPSFW